MKKRGAGPAAFQARQRARLRATATPPCRISRRCPIAQRPAPDEGSSGPSHRRGITGHSRRGRRSPHRGRGRAATRLLDEGDGGAEPRQPGLRAHGAPQGPGCPRRRHTAVAVQRDAVSRAAGPSPRRCGRAVEIGRGIAAELQLPPGMATGGEDLLQRLRQAVATRSPGRHRSAGRAGPTVCRAWMRRAGAARPAGGGIMAGEVLCHRMGRHAAEIGAQPPGEGQALRLSSASSMARSDSARGRGGDERVQPSAAQAARWRP